MRIGVLLLAIGILLLTGEVGAQEASTPPGTAPALPGETIFDAIPIPQVPFSAVGATCGRIDDYQAACPDSGAGAPDVVFSLSPTTSATLDIDLCLSDFNTKMYVYQDDASHLVACNDDGFCFSRSRIEALSVSPGRIYFIVIDGRGTACGNYLLVITDHAACKVGCPSASAVMESEPFGIPVSADHYNGGCNSYPSVFESLFATSGGCVDLCGQTGIFVAQGEEQKDEDWYSIMGSGNSLTVELRAEVAAVLRLITETDCSGLQYDEIVGAPCQVLTLSHQVANSTEAWIEIAARDSTALVPGIYSLHVCGLGGYPPVKKTTWGMLKRLYR